MIASLARTSLLCLSVLACGLASRPVPWGAVAWAGQSLSDLEKVSAKPSPADRLPLAAPFFDEDGKSQTLARAFDGRPAVLLFVDYGCKNMCGAMLALTSRALAVSALDPGQDYRMIAIGLDPNQGVAAARELKESLIDPGAPLFAATQFLTGTESSIAAAAAAVHYRYSKDAEHGQFAHAAAVLVVTDKGRVTRVIPATAVTGETLRSALIGARRGIFSPILDAVRLLCYGYSPNHGLYNKAILATLRAEGAIALLLLAAGILFLVRRAAA